MRLKNKTSFVMIAALVVAMFAALATPLFAAADGTAVIVGVSNPGIVALGDASLTSGEIVKSFKTGDGSATEFRLGYARTFTQLNQDVNVEQYSLTAGKLFAVGNQDSTIKFKVGAGAGLYRVVDSKTIVNDVGLYAVARANLTKEFFAETKYTSVRRTGAGDGWSVSLGYEL